MLWGIYVEFIVLEDSQIYPPGNKIRYPTLGGKSSFKITKREGICSQEGKSMWELKKYTPEN